MSIRKPVIIIGTMVVVLAAVWALLAWRAPSPTKVETPPPNHLVMFGSLIGETVPAVEEKLGLADRKAEIPIGKPKIVPVRDGATVTGISDEQLVVLAVCVPDANATPLDIYFGVAPLLEVSRADVDRARANQDVIPSSLAAATGCRGAMGGVFVSGT
ncbi:hypothetical protein ACFXHA_31635 [Nocardia sp. NPDC059240]|uniref:hypothetical protein n=1 Tax=Nocardia sp. NPDC059240 TaxID=3346786 RepID=UPI00367EFD62